MFVPSHCITIARLSVWQIFMFQPVPNVCAICRVLSGHIVCSTGFLPVSCLVEDFLWQNFCAKYFSVFFFFFFSAFVVLWRFCFVVPMWCINNYTKFVAANVEKSAVAFESNCTPFCPKFIAKHRPILGTSLYIFFGLIIIIFIKIRTG